MNSAPTLARSDSINESKENTMEFDASLTEDERRFYLKAYPSVGLVRERKVHCTVCKVHIGTAPNQEPVIKMHPILRVTHCTRCHDFYNSGEFSKGEDGSELYCRWCGQGGEVYCCSNCPYVFCKSCIVKNLSRGVVADIEQNENWSCFSCAPKILWPLRAQHWALMNFIEKQKKDIEETNVPETEKRQHMALDRSTCCRLAKAKCGNMSDSLESLDSEASRRSYGSMNSLKKTPKVLMPSGSSPAAKRLKTSNDEVVCTPDLISMLEPDCQITLSPKQQLTQPNKATSTPKIMSIQGTCRSQLSISRSSVPPPLVLRNTSVQMRPVVSGPIVRRTVVGPRTPSPGGGVTPVYHTINGYRIDLNSAAQQETFRLPNGKLIQVKRQGSNQNSATATNNWPQRSTIPGQQQHTTGSVQIPQTKTNTNLQSINIQQPSGSGNQITQQHPQLIRYQNSIVGNTTVTPLANNSSTQIHVINGTPAAPVHTQVHHNSSTARSMIRHAFPDTAIGQARSQLQDQVFNAMDICQHLIGKIQTLTNSNAYKQARNYLEVKELYIHLSYLLTYAIGRFKGLQDKCLGDMRRLGFVNDADSLENGQLAAGVDYVRYSRIDDVELFNTGSNSFHNQVYEYRKSLHTTLKDVKACVSDTLPSLCPIGSLVDNATDSENLDSWQGEEESLIEPMEDEALDVNEKEEQEDSLLGDDEGGKNSGYSAGIVTNSNVWPSNKREEISHAYDRKLTRLIERYPSIWCTRHPDYGNFDVTRKHWRFILSHFKRSENIKLRWKNIRKRYVRIERRIREGKRFSGYFDKATNFLANRDLPLENWVNVDCGDEGVGSCENNKSYKTEHVRYQLEEQKYIKFGVIKSNKPTEILPLDLKIINYVKSNPILWRNSNDPACAKVDEQMRTSLWMCMWKSMPNLNCDDIIGRWKHLYEMYKTFRLKTIKNRSILANLELKYSKYLAKLYFLYKIDEEALRNEIISVGDIDEQPHTQIKLNDMPDDKEFLLQLVRIIRQYPLLWDKLHADFKDVFLRQQAWNDIETKLKHFKRDVKTIKLRWQLAEFSYFCFHREERNLQTNERYGKYFQNLPVEEMCFLNV